MNLQNNEFVVAMTSDDIDGLIHVVTNFGRLFYSDGTRWVMKHNAS